MSLWLAVTLLVGCKQVDRYDGAFDLPHARGILAADAGPFTDPVAYVANRYDGQISMLLLKQGRFVVDGDTASFARSAPLAAGRDRVISDLSPWSPDGTTAVVFAADQSTGTLLRIAHIDGLDADGHPIRRQITVGETSFTGSGNASLVDLEFMHGFSSSETWTIERSLDPDTWWVKGSRSGRLGNPAITGEPYVGEQRVISFTIEGTSEPEDVFEVTVDAGVDEIDVGGSPVGVLTAPDQSRVALVVADPAVDNPVLRWLDPVAETTTDVVLAVDAVPGRMEFARDALFVADNNRPAVWEVRADDTVIEHVLPWPVVDVAALVDDDGTGELYVVPTSGRSVWMLDLADGTLIDINPHVPGPDGLHFDQPVQGIAAVPVAHDYVERDEWETRLGGRSVAVSMQDNRVVFMEQGTGCLTRDILGPRTDNTGSNSGTVDYTTDIPGFVLDGRYPFLTQNETNERHVQVHPCGGVARAEVWTLTYRRNLQAWQVEGSGSGLQDAPAFEDERYVSDEGAVSFLIRAGGNPSEEGWKMQFRSNQGVIEANGEFSDPGLNVAMTLPGDPLFFSFLAGAEGQQTERAYVFVIAEGADTAVRIDPTSGITELEWW